MHNLVVVLGPTATGKTKLAVKIADKHNGEVISADSRQVYKGMDIGTGKDLSEYHIKNKKIPYHLIDILDPIHNYSVFQFQKDFLKVYNSINQNNKLPILCGGTGLYIESILLNYQMPSIPPNNKLRAKLENKTIDYLIKYLQSIDENLYDSQHHTTKRRLIRTIEISLSKEELKENDVNHSIDHPLILGLTLDREELLMNIKERLDLRLKSGMIDEVRSLINNGIDLDRLKYFGLEYKFIGQYLYNEIKYEDMITKLNYAINRFSKRQMTFFRRMEKRGLKICWLSKNDFKFLDKSIEEYLANEL